MDFPRAASRGDRPTIIARSVHGVEWVCAAEVSAIPGVCGSIELSRRQVEFGMQSLGSGLLDLRTADDVFLKLAATTGRGPAKADLPAFGRDAARLPWESALQHIRAVRDLPAHGTFDVVASLEGRPGYNRFDVERHVGAALAPVLSADFLERDGDGKPAAKADLTVRVIIDRTRSTIALRLGSRPLHRRAYKVRTGPGTLHPPVAATLTAIGAPAAGVLLDPFCGDGTIVIEAAMAHRGLTVLARDLDPLRVQNTAENALEAGVDIDAQVADAGTAAEQLRDVDAVITNPPWESAVAIRGQARAAEEDFWHVLAPVLGPRGRVCCVTDAGLDMTGTFSRLNWEVGLQQRIRLAGRLADVLLAAPPGRPVPQLPPDLAGWRDKALTSGVITATGF